jgi:acid phosphatase
LSWTAALEQFERTGIDSLPPAIILDLDDTIISTVLYRGYLLQNNKTHDRDNWNKFIQYEKAPLLPGVIDFFKETSRLGIKIIIISNRICLPTRQDTCPIKTQTLSMLRKAGLIFDQDDLLFRNQQPDWGMEKSSRREFLAKRYRILLIIGDDIADMIPEMLNTPATSRKLYTKQYQALWGERWFILPNPVYGSWRQIAGKKLETVIKTYKR